MVALSERGGRSRQERMVRHSNSAECRDNSPTAKGGWCGDLGLALRSLTYLSEGYSRPKPVDSRRHNETAAALSLSPSANTARSTEQSYPGLLEA